MPDFGRRADWHRSAAFTATCTSMLAVSLALAKQLRRSPGSAPVFIAAAAAGTGLEYHKLIGRRYPNQPVPFLWQSSGPSGEPPWWWGNYRFATSFFGMLTGLLIASATVGPRRAVVIAIGSMELPILALRVLHNRKRLTSVQP